MAAAVSFQDLVSRFGLASAERLGGAPSSPALASSWPELDAALPDGGLPRGVVEIATPRAIGGASITLAAIRAAHAKDARAWCAWIDPEGTLYAPGLAAAGVDLARLLVVRPPRGELARVAVKVAAARAFDVIAIDMDAAPGAREAGRARRPRGRKQEWPGEVLVRKLALLAEEGGATILLHTDARAPRAMPWPVALRLEVARGPEALAVRVAKDRRGRVGPVKTVPMRTRPMAAHGDAREETHASPPDAANADGATSRDATRWREVG